MEIHPRPRIIPAPKGWEGIADEILLHPSRFEDVYTSWRQGVDLPEARRLASPDPFFGFDDLFEYFQTKVKLEHTRANERAQLASDRAFARKLEIERENVAAGERAFWAAMEDRLTHRRRGAVAERPEVKLALAREARGRDRINAAMALGIRATTLAELTEIIERICDDG